MSVARHRSPAIGQACRPAAPHSARVAVAQRVLATRGADRFAGRSTFVSASTRSAGGKRLDSHRTGASGSPSSGSPTASLRATSAGLASWSATTVLPVKLIAAQSTNAPKNISGRSVVLLHMEGIIEPRPAEATRRDHPLGCAEGSGMRRRGRRGSRSDFFARVPGSLSSFVTSNYKRQRRAKKSALRQIISWKTCPAGL